MTLDAITARYPAAPVERSQSGLGKHIFLAPTAELARELQSGPARKAYVLEWRGEGKNAKPLAAIELFGGGNAYIAVTERWEREPRGALPVIDGAGLWGLLEALPALPRPGQKTPPSANISLSAADVMARLAGMGYKREGPDRVYARAAICHEPSPGSTSAATIQFHDGPNAWWAYCHKCQEKVSDGILRVLGQPKSWGGARDAAGRKPVDYQARADEAHKEALGGRESSTEGLRWELTAKGGYRAGSATNAYKAIDGLGLGARYRYNAFSDRIERSDGAAFDADREVRNARVAIGQAYDFAPTRESAYDAIAMAADANAYNPIADWLNGLRWDGKDRLAECGKAYFGTANTELQNAIGRLVITGAAARALRPGIGYPYLVILQGKQGYGKTAAIRTLAWKPEYFDEGIELRGLGWRKALQERIASKWVLEIADLDALSGIEMSNAKALITDLALSNRLAFRRDATDMPMHTILLASANASAFLSDDTGVRRYPVLECLYPLPTRRLREDLPQLYAQAISEWRAAGEPDVALPPALWEEANEASNKYQLESAYKVWAEDYLSVMNEVQSLTLLTAWHEQFSHRISNQEKSRVMAALGFVKATVNGRAGWRRE